MFGEDIDVTHMVRLWTTATVGGLAEIPAAEPMRPKTGISRADLTQVEATLLFENLAPHALGPGRPNEFHVYHPSNE